MKVTNKNNINVTKIVLDFLEGKIVANGIADKLIAIFEKTQHKRIPIPTIYDH